MTAGRPRKYADPDELAARIQAYMADCTEQGTPPSVAGLCYFLGFADKQALSTYETYGEEFSLPIKRARLKIEMDRQTRLIDPRSYTPGLIFDLKNNHGWKDKTETEHGGQVSVVNEIVIRGVRDNERDSGSG